MGPDRAPPAYRLRPSGRRPVSTHDDRRERRDAAASRGLARRAHCCAGGPDAGPRRLTGTAVSDAMA